MTRRLLKIIALPLLLAGVISPHAAYAACVSPAGIKGEFFYNDDFAVLQFCNGTDWIGMYGGSGGGGSGVTDGDKGDISVSGTGASWMIDDDALDFTEFKDALSLDASTDIAISGSQVFSFTNTGTGNSLVVSDQASDTTPFVIDAAGQVGIGIAIPTQALDVVGKVKADSMILKVMTGLAAPTGGSSTQWSTNGTDVWRATGKVGIGTATPGQALEVNGSVLVNAANSGLLLYPVNMNGTSYTSGQWYWISNQRTANGASSFTIGEGATPFATPRLTILPNTGNVGIGTTSPTAPLHVIDNNGNGIMIERTSATARKWNTLVLSTGALDFYDQTAGADRMVISTAGNVGIGTTNLTMSSGKLPRLVLYSDGTQPNLGAYTNTAGNTNVMVFNNPNGEVGWINTNGSVTSYGTASDRRLKEHIVPTQRGLSELMRIGVEDFNFRADKTKKTVQGFIAQDLNDVYPEAVRVGGDDPVKGPWGVDYGRLTPLLVRAIQDLKADNDNLRVLIGNQNRLMEAQGRDIAALRAEVEAQKAAP